MSPTLGTLPSNQPAPTGLCQIKRGAAEGAIGVSAGTGVVPMYDGGGNPMRISITPPRSGMWLIRAESLWYTDTNWLYWHWGVRCVPLDADGKGDDRNHCCQHPALNYCESCINTAYKLNANTDYYAEMFWPSASNGGTQYYATAPYWQFISGEFVED